MKNYPVLIFLIFFSYAVFPQTGAETGGLTLQRDSLIDAYRQHSDTITINTWINLMTSNRYLRQILRLDSIIVESSAGEVNTSDSAFQSLQKNNQQLREQLKTAYSEIDRLNIRNVQRQNIIRIVLIISGLIILVLVITTFIIIPKKLKNRPAAEKLKNLQAKLYFAEEELNRLRNADQNSNKQLEEVKKQYEEEIADLNAQKESLSDEKLLLENQIIEVKKAWEMKVQKQMEEENKTTGSGPDQRLQKKLQRQINALEAENKKLADTAELYLKNLEEKDKQLQELKNQPEQQKKTEKQKPSDSVDDSINNDPEKLEYEKLWQQNKDLMSDLAETRKNYENEIKTRLEIEKELRELLEKLRNKYL